MTYLQTAKGWKKGRGKGEEASRVQEKTVNSALRVQTSRNDALMSSHKLKCVLFK